MDAYIKQLLAEMADSAFRNGIQNILDEPIPDAVKRHLLKPLQPRKYRPIPPPRKAKARKRKAIQEEFDPILSQKVLRSVEDYQNELLGRKNSPSGRCHGRSEVFFAGGKWMCPRGTHRVLTPEPSSRV